MTLQAVFFGSIGTLVETSERQRQAFQAAFTEAGLGWVWDESTYRELLRINGGQKRIRAYAENTNTTLTDDQVRELHTAKSAAYQRAIREDGLQLRPGVAALVAGATAAGVRLAFVTTTTAENIAAIDVGLGEASPFSQFSVITNKQTVPNSKPAPDVYQYVLETMVLEPGAVLAIEDTQESLRAAVAAGVRCVATPGAYTQGQDFSAAVAIAEPGQVGDLAWLRSLVAETPVT